MEPGFKELINISKDRRKNAVFRDQKKLKRIVVLAAKRLGISFEEYMSRVTEIHVHRFNPATADKTYPYTLPSIMDLSSLISDNLRYNSKKRIIVNHNEIIDETAGYTLLRLVNKPDNLFKKLDFDLSEFSKKVKTNYDRAIIELESKIDSYETQMVKHYRKRYPDLDSTFVRVHLLKILGINIKFLSEKNYVFSKKDYYFHKK